MIRTVLYWFIAVLVLMVAAFFYFERSLMSDMVVFIVAISGLAALYITKNRGVSHLPIKDRPKYILLGFLVAASSFINYIIYPAQFWNPPYSIGEFGVLVSGLSLMFFAYLGYRNLLAPAVFPAFVLFCAQLYDTYQKIIDFIAAPLLGPTTNLTVLILNLIGVKASSSPDYIIEFLSRSGEAIRIQIVVDCTGVWSLSAFTASLLVVSLAFPKIFSRKHIKFIAFGYAGTYVANILRVVAICLSAYFYGYGAVTEATHKHAGWVAFSGWMIIFWYLFFSRHLLKKESALSKRR